MIVVQRLSELRNARNELEGPLGFVPTMGYLHEGHLSLVRSARKDCEHIAVSIFANPTQFGQNEDFSTYPRDPPRDIALLENEGVDLVWTPQVTDLYPPDFQTWVEVDKLTEPFEGEQRPTHFKGVTTIVAKLFNSVQPQRAYFGQKDAQQALVLRRMIRDLDFPVQLVVCPTIREKDGLAMSSRNSYLDERERAAATVLYRALSATKDAFAKGLTSARSLRQIAMDVLGKEPLANVQYVSVTDPNTLHEIEGHIEQGLVLMTVNIGETRLVDNVFLGDETDCFPSD